MFQNFLKRYAIVVAAAGILSILGLYSLKAWQGGDKDYESRQEEYASFAKHIYPNVHLVTEGKPRARVHSVYPPYAFPMFALFFGSGSMSVARFLLQFTSLAAIAVMVVYGARAWSFAGRQALALSALAVMAFSGNRTALALGQFSLVSMGLLTLQAVFLEKRRPYLAALCWSFAMIKPQIALPFALLFLLKREWRGLFAGGLVLVILSAIALQWTGLSPTDFFQSGAMREKLTFMKEGKYSSALWIATFHITPRMATAIALGLLSALGIVMLVWDWGKVVLFPYASAFCATLGFILFYHRYYDNIMLFPLLFATVQRGFQNRWKLAGIIVVSALVFSIYYPASMLPKYPILDALVFLAPILSCLWLWIPCRRDSQAA
jgi:hypothetical protein